VLTVESGLRGRRGVANGWGGSGRGLGVVHLDVLRHRGVAGEVAGGDTGCRWGVAEQTLKPCGFILFLFSLSLFTAPTFTTFTVQKNAIMKSVPIN